MRRILSILCCLILLCSFVHAAKDESLAGQIDSYMYTHGLSEENFALSYFNLETAETYDFNAQAFFAIGDVWTLPLHMYYCLQEYQGGFLPAYDDPNYNNPDYEYTINGMNLDTCRIESILSGNDEVNQAMRNAVPQFKSVINEEYGHIEESALPENFYHDNSYSTQFLMNCLLEISRESEIYGELMRTYDLAQPPDGLNDYGRPYKVLQIRGQEDGMICAVAEVNAPDSYLIACVVSQEAGGNQVLAEINALICNYVESTSKDSDFTSTETASTGFERSDSNFQVAAQNPNDMTVVIKWIGIALAGAAVLAGLLYLANYLLKLRYKRRRERE